MDAFLHEDASRKNLPSAEHQPLMQDAEQSPVQFAYARRNRDLDPQLVWRGKDEQDWSDLVVNAPPLYIQERVHPKALVDDLMRQSQQARRSEDDNIQPGFADLFADFNGLPSKEAKTEFYRHDANWSNRMIPGDSLQVMASLAEREGMRGKVQCIYIDPPYGIKFNSHFQWSTTSRDVRDGKADHITREPEQVKAFRDTWRDGVHSYLTYLRAPGLHGGGQPGAVEPAHRFAAAVQKMDRHTVLDAGCHNVASPPSASSRSPCAPPSSHGTGRSPAPAPRGYSKVGLWEHLVSYAKLPPS